MIPRDPSEIQRPNLKTLGISEPLKSSKSMVGGQGTPRNCATWDVPGSQGSLWISHCLMIWRVWYLHPKRKEIRKLPHLSPLDVSLIKVSSVWTHKRGQMWLLIQCLGSMWDITGSFCLFRCMNVWWSSLVAFTVFLCVSFYVFPSVLWVPLHTQLKICALFC